MKNQAVAQTIFEQIGGARFATMTGAKDFVMDGNSLIFKIPKARNNIKGVKITLTAMDDYTMTFFSQKGAPTFKVDTVVEREGIYFDMLEDVFSSVTGLATQIIF